MKCPKCKGELETRTHEHLRVERCTDCYGMLAAPHVLDEMHTAWMAETFLDVGSESLGKKYDKIDEIDCPVCEVRMDKKVDPQQTHIWLESCPKCERVWLDAGEFTDLKYDTFSDKFKSLLKGKRK